ncbi:hypothetical protein P8452_54786 [Trifolium repens]|nr:hypothetical protein P8452_54786 [Trifolium repens]
MVLWKTLAVSCLKINTNGFDRGTNNNMAVACGGNFWDFSTSFLGLFCRNLGVVYVFHAKIMTIILALELAHSFALYERTLNAMQCNALIVED